METNLRTQQEIYRKQFWLDFQSVLEAFQKLHNDFEPAFFKLLEDYEMLKNVYPLENEAMEVVADVMQTLDHICENIDTISPVNTTLQ